MEVQSDARNGHKFSSTLAKVIFHANSTKAKLKPTWCESNNVACERRAGRKYFFDHFHHPDGHFSGAAAAPSSANRKDD